MTRSYRFRGIQRLRKRSDFERVFGRRCSAGDDRLVVYVDGNGLGFNRLGLSVGRRVGGAVVRHRVKRLIREAFRLCQNDLPAGFDMICVARPCGTNGLEGYRASLIRLAGEASAKYARRGHSALQTPALRERKDG